MQAQERGCKSHEGGYVTCEDVVTYYLALTPHFSLLLLQKFADTPRLLIIFVDYIRSSSLTMTSQIALEALMKHPDTTLVLLDGDEEVGSRYPSAFFFKNPI